MRTQRSACRMKRQRTPRRQAKTQQEIERLMAGLRRRTGFAQRAAQTTRFPQSAIALPTALHPFDCLAGDRYRSSVAYQLSTRPDTAVDVVALQCQVQEDTCHDEHRSRTDVTSQQ